MTDEININFGADPSGDKGKTGGGDGELVKEVKKLGENIEDLNSILRKRDRKPVSFKEAEQASRTNSENESRLREIKDARDKYRYDASKATLNSVATRREELKGVQQELTAARREFSNSMKTIMKHEQRMIELQEELRRAATEKAKNEVRGRISAQRDKFSKYEEKHGLIRKDDGQWTTTRIQTAQRRKETLSQEVSGSTQKEAKKNLKALQSFAKKRGANSFEELEETAAAALKVSQEQLNKVVAQVQEDLTNGTSSLIKEVREGEREARKLKPKLEEASKRLDKQLAALSAEEAALAKRNPKTPQERKEYQAEKERLKAIREPLDTAKSQNTEAKNKEKEKSAKRARVDFVVRAAMEKVSGDWAAEAARAMESVAAKGEGVGKTAKSDNALMSLLWRAMSKGRTIKLPEMGLKTENGQHEYYTKGPFGDALDKFFAKFEIPTYTATQIAEAMYGGNPEKTRKETDRYRELYAKRKAGTLDSDRATFDPRNPHAEASELAKIEREGSVPRIISGGNFGTVVHKIVELATKFNVDLSKEGAVQLVKQWQKGEGGVSEEDRQALIKADLVRNKSGEYETKAFPVTKLVSVAQQLVELMKANGFKSGDVLTEKPLGMLMQVGDRIVRVAGTLDVLAQSLGVIGDFKTNANAPIRKFGAQANIGAVLAQTHGYQITGAQMFHAPKSGGDSGAYAVRIGKPDEVLDDIALGVENIERMAEGKKPTVSSSMYGTSKLTYDEDGFPVLNGKPIINYSGKYRGKEPGKSGADYNTKALLEALEGLNPEDYGKAAEWIFRKKKDENRFSYEGKVFDAVRAQMHGPQADILSGRALNKSYATMEDLLVPRSFKTAEGDTVDYEALLGLHGGEWADLYEAADDDQKNIIVDTFRTALNRMYEIDSDRAVQFLRNLDKEETKTNMGGAPYKAWRSDNPKYKGFVNAVYEPPKLEKTPDSFNDPDNIYREVLGTGRVELAEGLRERAASLESMSPRDYGVEEQKLRDARSHQRGIENQQEVRNQYEREFGVVDEFVRSLSSEDEDYAGADNLPDAIKLTMDLLRQSLGSFKDYAKGADEFGTTASMGDWVNSSFTLVEDWIVLIDNLKTRLRELLPRVGRDTKSVNAIEQALGELDKLNVTGEKDLSELTVKTGHRLSWLLSGKSVYDDALSREMDEVNKTLKPDDKFTSVEEYAKIRLTNPEQAGEYADMTKLSKIFTESGGDFYKVADYILNLTEETISSTLLSQVRKALGVITQDGGLSNSEFARQMESIVFQQMVPEGEQGRSHKAEYLKSKYGAEEAIRRGVPINEITWKSSQKTSSYDMSAIEAQETNDKVTNALASVVRDETLRRENADENAKALAWSLQTRIGADQHRKVDKFFETERLAGIYKMFASLNLSNADIDKVIARKKFLEGDYQTLETQEAEDTRALQISEHAGAQWRETKDPDRATGLDATYERYLMAVKAFEAYRQDINAKLSKAGFNDEQFAYAQKIFRVLDQIAYHEGIRGAADEEIVKAQRGIDGMHDNGGDRTMAQSAAVEAYLKKRSQEEAARLAEEEAKAKDEEARRAAREESTRQLEKVRQQEEDKEREEYSKQEAKKKAEEAKKVEEPPKVEEPLKVEEPPKKQEKPPKKTSSKKRGSQSDKPQDEEKKPETEKKTRTRKTTPKTQEEPTKKTGRGKSVSIGKEATVNITNATFGTMSGSKEVHFSNVNAQTIKTFSGATINTASFGTVPNVVIQNLTTDALTITSANIQTVNGGKSGGGGGGRKGGGRGGNGGGGGGEPPRKPPGEIVPSDGPPETPAFVDTNKVLELVNEYYKTSLARERIRTKLRGEVASGPVEGETGPTFGPKDDNAGSLRDQEAKLATELSRLEAELKNMMAGLSPAGLSAVTSRMDILGMRHENEVNVMAAKDEQKRNADKQNYISLLREEYKLREQIWELQQRQEALDKKGADTQAISSEIDGLYEALRLNEEFQKEINQDFNPKDKEHIGKVQEGLERQYGEKGTERAKFQSTFGTTMASETEGEYKKLLDQRLALEKQGMSAQHKLMLSYNTQEKGAYQDVINITKQQLAQLDAKLVILKNSDLMRRDEVAALEAAYKVQNKLNRAEQAGQKGGATSVWDMMRNDMSRAMARVFDYGVAMRALNSIPQAFRKIYDLTVQLDSALTNLRIVTGENEEGAQKMIITYNKLGKELGATTQQIAESANEWLRQGYSAQEAGDLIDSTMKLSKLGMIESGEATQYLTSMLKGFKMEASSALEIVDKLTTIDLAAAVSAGDIALALSRTATSAQLAGMSLDETASVVTVIGEVTQRSMESVGESVKTLLSRYGNVKAGVFTQMGLDDDGETTDNINDIEKVLGKLGIPIRSSNLEMRAIGDVLDELAGKWQTLDSVSKNAENVTALVS